MVAEERWSLTRGGRKGRFDCIKLLNGGKSLKQVMVPVQLRSRIMELAHGSIMGGLMGIKKTVDKIQSAFYWPGIQGAVTRYCKSCVRRQLTRVLYRSFP